MSRQRFKNDQYRRSRGGYSRLLKISCAKCGNLLFYYQKDGPGILKWTYVDRMLKLVGAERKEKLVCTKCERELGLRFIYKKEKRPAYRLFVGAVVKSIVKANSI